MVILTPASEHLVDNQGCDILAGLPPARFPRNNVE